MLHVQQVQCDIFTWFLCSAHLLPLLPLALVVTLRRGVGQTGCWCVQAATQVGVVRKG